MPGTSTIPPYPAPVPVAPPKRKRRLVLPVLAGGFVGAIVLAAAVGMQEPERYPAPAPAAPQGATVAPAPADQVGLVAPDRLSALDLQPGDCYNNGELPPAPGTSTPISTVDAVPCASSHTRQVISKIAYSATDTLADVRATRAGADCEGELRQKVDTAALAQPGYAIGTIMAVDDTTWNSSRTVACVIMSDSPRTGSVLK
jgi:hypothetical protein